MLYKLYFSPTGGTKHITDLIVDRYMELSADMDCKEINVSISENRKKHYSFEKNDMVIVTSPTYAGRIPNKIMPFFRDNIEGNGAKCIIAVTYGNRSYDHSLLEMVRLMEKNHLTVIAAGAFVTRHSMSKILGAGRPDENDKNEIRKYVEEIKHKLDTVPHEQQGITLEGEVGPYYIPKKEDGDKASFLKAKAVVDAEKCISCGKCAEACVMGSISEAENYATVDICIKCHSCIRICPVEARYFDHPDLISHIKMLESTYGNSRKENKYFV